MVIYLKKKMERLSSGDEKIIFGTNLRTLSIGLVKCGRVKWQEAEATRKYFNTVLTRQDKIISLPPSSSRSSRTQSHWSYTSGQRVDSEQFLRVHSSYWMCNQFSLYHKFRIDSGRTKFGQGKTDSILYGCGSHGQGSQRSAWAWFDQTTSCMVQAENVEMTPRHGVLGRYPACST